jgi:hypothetical protein
MEAFLAAPWQVPMPEVPSRSRSSDSNDSAQSLTDRVLARVQHESSIVDRLPKSRRRSPTTDREARSLRRVFSDLGDSYRDYRRRTGEPVSADIRAAADRFRKERNVAALVSVAASLDALEILPW